MASKAAQEVLEEYRTQIAEMIEGRNIQKLVDQLVMDVEEEVINELAFPEGLRTMSEDDLVMEIHDIIAEELIKQYFRGGEVIA